MTFDDFIAQYTGKPVDFDGIYPNQCMDLMHYYVYYVLGITDKLVLAKPWASRVFTEFAWPQYFDKIDNTPTNMPQKGDIFFFDEKLNYDPTVGHGYGHVCIVTDANINSFHSFDANFPTGSLPHIQTHSYNYALGWLHPKQQHLTPEQALQQIHTIMYGGDNDGDARYKTKAVLTQAGY